MPGFNALQSPGFNAIKLPPKNFQSPLKFYQTGRNCPTTQIAFSDEDSPWGNNSFLRLTWLDPQLHFIWLPLRFSVLTPEYVLKHLPCLRRGEGAARSLHPKICNWMGEMIMVEMEMMVEMVVGMVEMLEMLGRSQSTRNVRKSQWVSTGGTGRGTRALCQGSASMMHHYHDILLYWVSNIICLAIVRYLILCVHHHREL